MSNTRYSIPITKAFELVKKGEHAKALQTITDAGVPEPEQELELIIGFVRCMDKYSM